MIVSTDNIHKALNSVESIAFFQYPNASFNLHPKKRKDQILLVPAGTSSPLLANSFWAYGILIGYF
jgi:hypothetical protein